MGRKEPATAEQFPARTPPETEVCARSAAGNYPGVSADQMNVMRRQPGDLVWAIADGYIPPSSTGPEPDMTSHEAACILNAGDADAHIEITVYFEDREPAGPYLVTVPAQRTAHVRFNDLEDPEPIPRGRGYAGVLRSDVPVVVQHTRLDSRQAENALLSTIAYPMSVSP
jgi:hypothetical protein